MYLLALKEWIFIHWLKKAKAHENLTHQETTILLPWLENKGVCSSFILDTEKGKQKEQQPVCHTLVMEISQKQEIQPHSCSSSLVSPFWFEGSLCQSLLTFGQM